MRDPALLDDQHPIRQHQRLLHVVRHEHGAEAMAQPERLDQLLHADPGQRIACAQRFVEQQDAGRVHQGHPLALAAQAATGPDPEIGLIFQEPRLFPWLTVAQNIAFGAPAQGHDTSHDAGRIAALLEEVGLAGYGAALPKQLSGGQAQRVALARGLYPEPRVLLLDEPFSAVDAFTRMRLQDLLARVASERRLTVLLVTHDIDEALYLSDRIVLMDGRPGPARAEFAVGRARPRARSDLAGAALKASILDSLHAVHAI